MIVGTRVRPVVAMAALALAGCATVPAHEATAGNARTVDTVTVAYGRVRRDHLTGAVGSLTEEDVSTIRAQRVEELFQGRLAGVQVVRGPGGALSIRIRGVQGLGYSSEEPLIVVDGMPTQSQGFASVLDALTPQDIARIDVLKDAASTAAYGVRGANGVILITTRRAGDTRQ